VIGRVAGKLIAKHPPHIVVDVNGIGYEIDVPMSTLYQLPATGTDVALLTHLIVREDAHQLYGSRFQASARAPPSPCYPA
jgi:Holliday junction DNA helicase RuvA